MGLAAAGAIVARVLKDFGSLGTRSAQEIVVFNDEAHHCYADRPIQLAPDHPGKLSMDEAEAKQEARVWFTGVQAVAKRVGVKAV